MDPFKILKEYNEFNNSVVSYNEDYVTTERFLKNKNKYNSFILGSSRAGCAYKVNEWEKELKSNDNGYSFTASNESIFGIWGKLRLLDEENIKIKNALLVFDTDVTFKKVINSKGHIYIKHPRVSKESKKAFISEYLKDYVFTGFFIRYLDYKIFKTKRDYMSGFLDFSNENDNRYVAFNVDRKENAILSDSIEFYKKKKNVFYSRSADLKYNNPVIGSKSIEYLNDIKKILKKHNTNYKIVISPLYDQKKLNISDLNIIQEIFQKDKVFDFSGKNEITSSKFNYYESSHYRHKVGTQILKSIYDKAK